MFSLAPRSFLPGRVSFFLRGLGGLIQVFLWRRALFVADLYDMCLVILIHGFGPAAVE